MSNFLYHRDGDIFTPTPLANGPWAAAILHGASVSGLFGFLAEEKLAATPGFMFNRMTMDMMKPVPNAPLKTESTLLRDGGRLKLWQFRLFAETSLVAQALVVLQYMDDVELPPTAPAIPEPLQHHSTLKQESMLEWMTLRRPDVPHSIHMLLEMRLVTPWDLRGEGSGWMRLPAQILENVPCSPLVHTCMLADMGNGMGHLNIKAGLGSINADITLSLYRYPTSEWVGMQARNVFQPHGTGIIHAQLFDEQGGIGHVMQTVQIKSKPKLAVPF